MSRRLNDVRRKNLRRLIAQAGGPAAAARRLQMSDSQLSQIAGEQPTRGIGDKVAERIEATWQLPPGSLDRLETDGETTVVSAEEHESHYRAVTDGPKNPPKREGLLLTTRIVPLLSWAKLDLLRDGRDMEAREACERVHCPVDYKPELYALPVVGDSMDDGSHDSYREGDTIWVDPTVRPQHNRDVVVILDDGRRLLRRFRDTPEGRFLVALNQKYPEPVMRMSDSTFVAGVVVYAGAPR